MFFNAKMERYFSALRPHKRIWVLLCIIILWRVLLGIFPLFYVQNFWYGWLYAQFRARRCFKGFLHPITYSTSSLYGSTPYYECFLKFNFLVCQLKLELRHVMYITILIWSLYCYTHMHSISNTGWVLQYLATVMLTFSNLA